MRVGSELEAGYKTVFARSCAVMPAHTMAGNLWYHEDLVSCRAPFAVPRRAGD